MKEISKNEYAQIVEGSSDPRTKEWQLARGWLQDGGLRRFDFLMHRFSHMVEHLFQWGMFP